MEPTSDGSALRRRDTHAGQSVHRMAPEARPFRPDASMLLLNEVMHKPLDPGYAEAAARRAAGTARPLRTITAVRIGVIALILGFGTTAAAVTLRAPQPDVIAARAVLEQEIRDRRAHVDELRDEIDELDAEIEVHQNAALSAAHPQLLADLERDAAASGSLGVTGPGLVVTMRDAPTIAQDPFNPVSRVQDYDVQVVVNSLWASGAEAISINDQRLTATSAIRSAGDAILVDLVGLSGPYTIAAIGNSDILATYFARSLGAQHLSILSSRYGIASSVSPEDDLRLRAGQSARLFYADLPAHITFHSASDPVSDSGSDLSGVGYTPMEPAKAPSSNKEKTR